nr:IMP dehydrogenase [Nanoarchaeota archaeon]
MVKKIIIDPHGFTFSQFSLLTDYSSNDCRIQDISLETKLAENLTLRIPLLSAAMRSVTGYEMALELGKAGGLGVLPARLPIEEQVDIVKRIKSYEMSFVEDPLIVRETTTLEEVLKKVKEHGFSKIPVVDKNNRFLGIFIQQHYWELDISPSEKVTAAMIPFDKNNNKKIPYCVKPDLSVDEAKELLEKLKQKYIVVLDEQGRLGKLAFRKDVGKVKVASTITTHEGWKERVKANLDVGVDLIVIDTSDAYNEFTEEVIKEYKKMKAPVPICAGNIITYEGALFLMEAGADIVKGGMSAGSICTTKREKGVGRAPLTALIEMDKARNNYLTKTGRYVPIIIDGGVSTAADMIIGLTMANANMMGNYFNRFYEAAGDKLDKDGNITTIESHIKEVVTYGEGSEFAQNLGRYGHESLKTFFPEGVKDKVPYAGRLKPNVKADILKIKAALVNAGCINLEEFREKSVIELISEYAKSVVGETHSIKGTG